MIRIPRVILALHDQAAKLPGYAVSLRERLTGKSLAYVGAGLALAGTGAAAAAGGFAGPADPVSQASSLNRATAPIGASQPPGAHSDHASIHQWSAHRLTFRRTRGGGHTRAWDAIERYVAGQPVSPSGHAPLPAQDRLTPVGTSGPQSWMPMTPARYDNATTIVRQVIAKKMGLRSAVIAVATAMQESTLMNINYGDSDSLGLFQQRPSCGWGTAAQILHPAYAADAFLSALHSYQDRDPNWSEQPLWQTAQGVQASGLPTAYARWESQAAGLVHSIARHLV